MGPPNSCVMIQSMKAVQPRLTYSELRWMPDDGKRYELIDGEVFVNPSPNVKHQRVLRRLAFSMDYHAEAHKLGEVFVAPLDVVFSEKTSLQPDVIFVSSARRGIIGPEYIIGAPDLVAEILSPYRVAFDRVTKLGQYARHGVGEYWIIDPAAESVEVCALVGSNYELKATLSGHDHLETPLLPGWKISLRHLFAD